MPLRIDSLPRFDGLKRAALVPIHEVNLAGFGRRAFLTLAWLAGAAFDLLRRLEIARVPGLFPFPGLRFFLWFGHGSAVRVTRHPATDLPNDVYSKAA